MAALGAREVPMLSPWAMLCEWLSGWGKPRASELPPPPLDVVISTKADADHEAQIRKIASIEASSKAELDRRVSLIEALAEVVTRAPLDALPTVTLPPRSRRGTPTNPD
jgi:hypothetical protein